MLNSLRLLLGFDRAERLARTRHLKATADSYKREAAKLLASHPGDYRIPINQALYDDMKAAGDDMSRFTPTGRR